MDGLFDTARAWGLCGVLFGCSWAAWGGGVSAAGDASSLPKDVIIDIRSRLGDGVIRTFNRWVDLNDDGRPEVVVYAVGPMICGTGGCNLLVYTPETNGYRRVGNIAITQMPIRVATERTKGWRNLVVHVAGGGAKPADMVLKFDGHNYPHNPTVPGGQVQPAALAAADVLIANFNSFEDAQPLPLVAAGDAGPVPSAVSYRCEGLSATPVSVVFHAQVDPPAAAITIGERQVVLFQARSASGARYVAEGVSFWEHHGDAELVWGGRSHACKVMNR